MKKEDLETEDASVYNLILKLRQEKLLVRNEKNNIQELNELIRSKTHKIIRTAWITTKERLLLYQREESSRNYKKVDYLLNSEFVAAKKALGFQNAIKVGNLLQVLRSQPAQLAKWLINGEQLTEELQNYSLVLQSIVVGLYGCFVFPEDTKFMLTLLYELAKLQLLNSDNPRRIIKQRICSFKHLYFLFHEVLQSAKFFLSAALEIPIIQLMSCTDYYLDVDPDKTLMRYRQNDGEITNLFKNAEEYRREVVTKLVEFTNTFITSLLENVYSFPKSISWIVCHISKIIEKSFGSKEANSIITELIFTLYICPVIVDPEQYGICNAQVTDIARHNLIQVGQILQSLALNKFEPTDLKYADLFELLDKNRVSNFIELLFFDMDNEEPPVESSPVVIRDIMLFTEHELNNLISILQRIQATPRQNDSFVKDDETIEDQLLSLSLSSRDNSPKSGRLTCNEETITRKANFFSLGSKNHLSRSVSEEMKNNSNVVLIFPIDLEQTDPIGLLPEEKIVDLSITVKSAEMFESAPAKIASNMPDTPNQNGDIKQSFNFQDEGSIGNTSDNLEAISEAASNHSVDSSIELENEDQNDNLSDMVSANVSGRGTPNISGRDTPSSQVCENDDRVMAEARQADVAQPQQNLSRQIRSEIDDKFCKFEIKKLLEGDETISIISETWSTDVLASDNETIDAGDSRHERQSLHLVDQAIQEVPIGNILDISETQSESAWSTDVMASDTERLTEIDNDDTVSVAQSDDTNSVARSDDTRSETDENIGSIRRLSTSSNSYVSNVPTPSNQNYISTVTVVSSATNYVASTNNPFLTNGGVNNINYLPSLPVLSTNATTNTTNYVTSSNFQEYRKVDIKNDRTNGKIFNHMEHIDNNANTVFKSLTLNNSEHLLTFSDANADIKNSVFNTSASTATTAVSNGIQNSISKEADLNNIAGPSGLNKKSSNIVEAENEYLKQSRNVKKYDDRPNEILLSNCSLNSSSSGSSSNSFENKNSHNENSEQWESKQWLNSSGSSPNFTLTPSESTSELSVLSVNNITNPVNIMNKKSVTLLNNRILKPSVSTGAIPKSISFDMSADKGLDDDSRSKRGGFFGKLRIGFKNRSRGKAFRNQDDYRLENEEFGSSKKLSESPVKINNTEASDDILAKYRTKPFVESSPIKENCDVRKSPKGRNIVNVNNEEINSFNDIKNKLRLVLSNTSEIPHYVKSNPISVKNKIETVLRFELGKARKLREWSNVARISEAIRCVNLLNDSSCLKLLKSMREDIILRSTYIQYLTTSKQELFFCDKYLDSLQDQISHDKHQCEKYLATLCVKDFLSEQETLILNFCDEFKQLSLADEKCDFLHNFYHKLYSIMNDSPSWQGVFHNRESTIKITLERFIMSKIYKNSIYPNGDGDRDRDRVLREHIEKLSKIITPDHKDLSIHKIYLRECPWLPAQDALRALNAYKTPRDKVKCVVHCAKCIMDLLALSQNNGSTTADDFTPVLVYVIIKVNPEALLSTVQYVNSFFHNRLFGEEEYWWTQFCAAVEYIKTMDYSD